VIRTAAGKTINYPTSDGTSETGELLAQNATAAALDLSFGVKAIGAYKYSSKSVAVPIELLQDSAVDIEAFVTKRLVTRLGRITNTHFTTGTGSGQPNGIVTAAGSGKVGTTGQTLTVIYDDLIDLQHSVDPAYRQPGNCRFMMNDASVKVIRKIKDTTNRPIFVPGYDNDVPGKPGGVPDTLLGDPIQVNQDVAVMAANAKSILYGDFSFYTIRDALDMQMYPLHRQRVRAQRAGRLPRLPAQRWPVRRCRRLGQILPEQRDLRALLPLLRAPPANRRRGSFPEPRPQGSGKDKEKTMTETGKKPVESPRDPRSWRAQDRRRDQRPRRRAAVAAGHADDHPSAVAYAEKLARRKAREGRRRGLIG
jgi:hypothetical protein